MEPMARKAAKKSMPTLVIGTSTSKLLKRPLAAGFSLLELLVVVTIIGIFVGMAVLSIDITGRDRESEREAARLKGLLDLVREEALMQNRDFGILFNDGAYRFYVYDYVQGAWLMPADDRLLAEHSLGETLRLDLMVEDRQVILDSEFDNDVLEKPAPQVLLLSSGEMTPFELEVYRDFDGGRYVLTAELDGEMEITERGFPPQ
jgi:general secretion pathway protein H